MPALPADRTDHAYFTLRRIWADHTMAGARGFYRLTSEDHITPRLFQNWVMAPDCNWLERTAARINAAVRDVRNVRWAYACEEFVPGTRRQFHKREFVIADIMLFFEDASGPGVIAFEVKRPGKAMQAEDGVKLGTYVEFARQSGIPRAYGCLLVSSRLVEKSVMACGSLWPALTWEELGAEQLAAAMRIKGASRSLEYTLCCLSRQYQLCGVELASSPTAPKPLADRYGSTEDYRAIEALGLPAAAERFVKGASCVESVSQGSAPEAPLRWLTAEPTLTAVRQRKWQTTSDRRVRRWDLGWRPSQERAW